MIKTKVAFWRASFFFSQSELFEYL